jgi:hypothetical protein
MVRICKEAVIPLVGTVAVFPLKRLRKTSGDSAYFADIRSCLLNIFIDMYNREDGD